MISQFNESPNDQFDVLSFGKADFNDVSIEGFDVDEPAVPTKICYLSKTNKRQIKFKLYQEHKLRFMEQQMTNGKGTLNDFDLSKLEAEYDYDTDEE